MVTDRTPFHPEDPTWPDQGPDRGTLSRGSESAAVLGCTVGASDGSALHVGSSGPVRRGEPGWAYVVGHLLEYGQLDVADGDEVLLTVDATRRAALSAGQPAPTREVSTTLAGWVAAAGDVQVETTGPDLTDRREWMSEFPHGTARIPCGGTHVGNFADVDAGVLLALDESGQQLTMRTTVGISPFPR